MAGKGLNRLSRGSNFNMESTRKTENTGSLQLQSKRTKYFHKEKLATFLRKDEKKTGAAAPVFQSDNRCPLKRLFPDCLRLLQRARRDEFRADIVRHGLH